MIHNFSNIIYPSTTSHPFESGITQCDFQLKFYNNFIKLYNIVFPSKHKTFV